MILPSLKLTLSSTQRNKVKNVKTVIEQPLEEVQLHRGKNTVTYEARLLKALLLQLEME